LILSSSDISINIRRESKKMNEKKSPLLLSFLIGGLLGGGITFFLATNLMRSRNAKHTRTRDWSDETDEQSYEDGVYCAPEGADMHYDVGKDVYYSDGE
jgi:hypothetical protein